MDNQTNNSDGGWIDARLATLAPSGTWHPDGRRALAEHLKRRDQPKAAASPRWVQLSMAAAILVSIGMVVTLLPWHVLWSGPKVMENRTSQPAEVAMPAPVSTPPESGQKPPEKKDPGVIPPQATDAKPESQYSDEARRAHIQGTLAVVQQPAQPSTEPEQKSPVRVGPGVTPPQAIPPMAEPVYSDDARLAKIQGPVILDVIIRADGTGKVESVIRSLGYGLDEKAVEAFEKWRFIPGAKDGKFVDVQLQVTINFKLY